MGINGARRSPLHLMTPARQGRSAVKIEAFIPLVTYLNPNSDAVAANVVAMAGHLGATLHALAINADIPPVSNALSHFLLDVPEMIREAEKLSRERGDHLLAL